jgi:hypothetical protein
VDEDLLDGFGLVVVVGSFDELAALESAAGSDQRDEMRSLDRAPAVLGVASMNLNATPSPTARDPGPRVISCGGLIVAKVDSTVGGAQADPVSPTG